jgi:hypothetical protein
MSFGSVRWAPTLTAGFTVRRSLLASASVDSFDTSQSTLLTGGMVYVGGPTIMLSLVSLCTQIVDCGRLLHLIRGLETYPLA